jgi:DNA-binding response OmpR family regulator
MDAPKDASGSGDGAATPRTSKMIAIVEDDEMLAKTFQDVLEDEPGWATRVLGDGEEAMSVIPTLRPDMIVLDVNLPGLDGISLYRIFRGHRETESTPILIVTASPEWDIQRHGLERYRLLRKPFDLDDLLSAVAALLDEGNGGSETSADV